jgi:superfamily I DNA/RNA helicase
MVLMDVFNHVLANPRPSLDGDGAQEQLLAYQEALTLFHDSSSVNVLTIPAGAGSGKTRTLVSTIIGLLRLGVPPELIESISFTNASADDFQARLITDLAALADEQTEDIKICNMGFSTIHKHAIDLLKKLEPHVGGVAYYFEDAGVSNNVNNPRSLEQESKEKAIKLAFYSSVVYGHHDIDLLASLQPFIDEDDSETRFILGNIKNKNHRELAEEFIRKDMMSDAGLGAFTNIDDNTPDFCLAVATDALMRLSLETRAFSMIEKRQRFGLPQFLMVDEAQDLDLIQLLYLRALALNGVSILMVGDPRQTLYEFRNSVSEWPFDSQFMQALFAGTEVTARISTSPLRTNYRSRREIVELAENISEAFVRYSTASDSKNVKAIHDPAESVVRSHHYESHDSAQNSEKNAPAVQLIEGAKTEEIDFLRPKPKASTAHPRSGPLSRLTKRATELTSESLSSADITALKRKITHIQIPNLCGGKHQLHIENAIHTLYERACLGESVAILTRNGLKPADIRYLRLVLKKKFKDIDNPSSLRINQINSEKNAPLSNYWFYGFDNDVHQEVPFSSMLIGAAIHYYLSWDKEASDEVRSRGLREINSIYPAGTITEAGTRNERKSMEDSIAVELSPYTSALVANASDYFPDATSHEVAHQLDSLKILMARFVTDVLMRYSVILWEAYQGKMLKHQPCRFQYTAIMRNPERGVFQLRPLNETKRFFKLFWEAVVSTPFQLSSEDRSLMERCGLSPEWMTVSTNLLNFPEELSIWKDEIDITGKIIDSEIKSRLDDFILQRELIHEQFSKLYHHKTRTYLREIAKEVGHLIRLDPSSEPDAVLIAGYEYFRGARKKARLNTWSKESRNKDSFMGLFEDLENGMRDINIKSKPKPKEDGDALKIPTITVTTVHSSKGLEWDHVMLFFPQATAPKNKDASGAAKDDSFKSVRDLLYVAVTRAIRTLTVVIGSDKNYKELPTNTCMLIAKHLTNELARDKALFDRKVEFNNLAAKRDGAVKKEVHVELQTSHSELEKALSCRLHHHVQHNRNLSSMVPLTSPSYSFFFHTAMSAICAGLIGQRLSIPDDPIADITQVLDHLATKPDLNEKLVYDALMANVECQINDLMQSMIPMYYLSGGKRFYEVMEYYTRNFAGQLASIVVGSHLFQNLLMAKRLPGHKIWIEKPLKDVLTIDEDGEKSYYPVLGIPDIKIAGPEINYVCDYKTVETPTDPEGELLQDTLLHISEKTFVQINLYQRLNKGITNAASLAEVIYVPDITLMEGDEIPSGPLPLPAFNNNAQYRVRSKLENAVVLYTDRFDQQRLDQTVESIADLRFQASANLESLSRDLFKPAPLIGTHAETEVTKDNCLRCPSAVHCQKNKKMEI